MSKKINKYGEKKLTLLELRDMMQKNLENDLVRSGWYYHYVEKKDPAFERGWRYAYYNIIRQLDEMIWSGSLQAIWYIWGTTFGPP